VCDGNVSIVVGHSRLGAAIVVEAGTILPAYAVNSYNPRCFIQYHKTSVSPIDWKEVTVDLSAIL